MGRHVRYEGRLLLCVCIQPTALCYITMWAYNFTEHSMCNNLANNICNQCSLTYS